MLSERDRTASSIISLAIGKEESRSGNNNSSSLVTSISLAYQTKVPRPNARSKQTIPIGEGKDMKKLLITGIALCFMGLAVPSFAAGRQDQTQQDQMKKDDGMKHDDMSKDSMSKDTPKN